MKKYFILEIFLIASIFLSTSSLAERCILYFTGIGCPHCAKTDPVVVSLPSKYSDLTIIEYEIYQMQENGKIMYDYNTKYNTGLGIPLVIFDQNNKIIGDIPILQNIMSMIEKEQNNCLLLDGQKSISEIDINSLPGKPKLWRDQRILMKTYGFMRHPC